MLGFLKRIPGAQLRLLVPHLYLYLGVLTAQGLEGLGVLLLLLFFSFSLSFLFFFPFEFWCYTVKGAVGL